jgi:hypothetical protein
MARRKTANRLSDINSFESEAESAALLTLATGRNVLEIGTFEGYSAALMSTVAAWVNTVDWHQGGHELGQRDTLLVAWRNLHDRPNVTMHVGRSADVLPFLRGPFGLVFIDGSHEYRDVRADIVNARRLSKLLLFHDYNYGFMGVMRAVDELCAETGVPLKPVAGSLVMVDLARDIMRPNGT